MCFLPKELESSAVSYASHYVDQCFLDLIYNHSDLEALNTINKLFSCMRKVDLKNYNVLYFRNILKFLYYSLRKVTSTM